MEGAFRIIDQASGDLRKMRREAERTDLAFAKLGATMDTVGSRRRAQDIDRNTRAVRSLGLETEQAGRRAQSFERRVRGADAATGGFGNRLGVVRKGLAGFAGDVWKLARPGGMLLGMGTAAGVAGQAISSLAGGAFALAPRMADLTGLLAPMTTGFIGLGGGIASVVLSMNELQKAFQGGPQGFRALREIGQQGRHVVLQLRLMQGVIRELKQSATRGVFGGLSSALSDLRRASPALQPILQGFGRTTGGLIATAGRRLTTPAVMRDLQNIGGQGAGVERAAGLGALNLADALRNLLVAGRPLTKWLSETVYHWTELLRNFTQTGRESGRLQQFFSRTQRATATLFHGVRDLWMIFRNLGRAARPAGEQLYHSMSRTLDVWARITSTPESRARLIRDFDHMATGLQAMARLAGAIGKALFDLGAHGQLANTTDALTRIVPSLERILSGMANTFGPPMARTLADFGHLLADMGGAGGPLVTALRLIDGVVRGLDAIINATGGGGGVASTALTGVLAARLLQRTGFISIGAGGVGRGSMLGGRASGAIAAEGVVGGAALGGMARSRMAARGAAGGMLGRLTRGVGVGGLLRGAGGAASRFVLPLMALQALWGGATAGGGVGNRAYGAANAALFGLPGLLTGMGGGNRSPVAADQSGLAIEMHGVEQGSRGLDRINQQIAVLRGHISNFADDTSREGVAYRAQLQEELASRKQLVAQLQAEAAARGQQRGSDVVAGLNTLYNQLLHRGAGRAGAMRGAVGAGLNQLSRIAGGGATAVAARTRIEEALLRGTAGTPLHSMVAGTIQRTEANAGRRVVAFGRNVFTGSQAERSALLNLLTLPQYLSQARRARGLTGTELDLVASLRASGLSGGAARREVIGLEAGGFSRRGVARVAGGSASQTYWNTEALSLSRRHPNWPVDVVFRRLLKMGAPEAVATRAVQPLFNRPMGRDHATGGRLAGSGLHDTVPVPGGRAAPGEMVVNRHTERRLNLMLAPHGVTLEGLTDRETRAHSQPFATGGRTSSTGGLMGSYHLQPGITSIGNRVLAHSPLLSVSSTTGGRHAANSFHYRRMAVDLDGPQAAMDRTAAWIQMALAGSLLEGIHNPGLSVKNGRKVPPSFWGATTWGEHRNHIHLAAGGAGGTTATGGRRATGSGAGRGRGPAQSIAAYNVANVAGGGAGINFGVGGIGFDAGVNSSRPGTGGGAGMGGTATARGGGGGGGVPAGRAQQIAYGLLGQYGWGPGQFGALKALWTGESGWRWNAKNASSGAYGIPQALPASKMSSAGADWLTNPATQIRWGMGYIKGRYGSPSAALNFWNAQSPHWYQRGGRMRWGGWHANGLDRTFNSPTMIGVGEGGAERVRVTPKGRGGHGGMTFAPVLNMNVNGGDPRRVHAAVTQALEEFASHLERHPIDGEPGDVSA